MLEIIKCYVALSVCVRVCVCVTASIWFAARRHKFHTPMPSRLTKKYARGGGGERNHVNAIFTFYDNNVIPFRRDRK